MKFIYVFSVWLLSLTLSGCSSGESSLEVIATAYTSSPGETDDTPSLAAWGDTLKPGMQAIAVSRDLIAAGLKYKTKVRISGFEGEYLVLDKMNKRWEKKIDIYMGNDRKKALEWGKQKVTIYWEMSE